MQIIQKLNIPAEYFYNKIVDSVIYDVKTHTGKSVGTKELKGFCYNKKFGSNIEGRISITDLEENKIYSFITETSKNRYEVEYIINKIDESSCEITYNEIMSSFGFFQNLNDKVVGTMLSHIKKKNMKKMLCAMEKLEGANCK